MKKLLPIVFALILGACGGAGSDKKSPPVSEKPVLTGVLIDSPVGNVAYRSETRNGITSVQGQFRYLAGETVVFFIGDLEFPPVKAASIITPWDMTSDSTTRNNILRLLQTLDNDGDPDNGIFIDPQAAAAFQNIDYTIASPTFETDVDAALKTISPGLTLVTADDANAHFATTMKKNLLGSWVLAEGSSRRNVITFIDESRYIIIHEHEDVTEDPEVRQMAGSVEYGEYSWDPLTGQFAVLAVLAESDGSGGLYGIATDSPPQSQTLTLSGNTLTLENDDGRFSVSRVISETDPLRGAWIYSTIAPDDVSVLTFLSATEYAVAHTSNNGVYQDREPRTAQALSGEFGRYSLVDEVFSVLAAHVDSDGDAGLFNAEFPETNAGNELRLESENMLVLVDNISGAPSETAYFSRIGYGGYAVDQGIVFADYFHAGVVGDSWQYSDDWDFTLSEAAGFPDFYQREAGDMFYKVNEDKSLSFVFGDAATGEEYTEFAFDMAARIDEGVSYQAMPDERCILTRHNEISVPAGVFIDVVREVCVDEDEPAYPENAVYAPYSDYGVSSVVWYARGVGPVKYLLTRYVDGEPNDIHELVSTTVMP